MSVTEFSFTSRVRPHVELGVGTTGPASERSGQWDVARWDTAAGLPQSEWAGLEPEFLDISCDVHEVEFATGRARSSDRFEAGFCSFVLNNDTGRYDPQLPGPEGGQLALIPGRALRVGVEDLGGLYPIQGGLWDYAFWDFDVWGGIAGTEPKGTFWLWRGYVDEIVPQYQPVDEDTFVVNAVDALGEVNRTDLPAVDPAVGANETATARVGRILTAAQWPTALRVVEPSSTPMLATTLGATVADLLSITAESEGGAAYGDQRGRVVFRARDWQTFQADAPVDATGLETSFRRIDIVTRAIVARDTDTVPQVFDDPIGISLYGLETWEATDLVCADPAQLPILGQRQLRVRNHENMPRVERVTFDAATGDDVIDLLCVADPRLPSRWLVRLIQTRGTVFNSQMFVTGIRHQMNRDSWIATVDLDAAWPFATPGEFRWDDPAAKWNVAQWTRAV